MHAEDSTLSGGLAWSKTGVRNNLSSVSCSRHPIRIARSSSLASSGVPHHQHEATRIDLPRETCLLGVRYPRQERPGVRGVKGRECGTPSLLFGHHRPPGALPWVLESVGPAQLVLV